MFDSFGVCGFLPPAENSGLSGLVDSKYIVNVNLAHENVVGLFNYSIGN